MFRRRFPVACAALLAACASTPPTAEVQVYTPPPAWKAGATYRYERLPSQAGQPGYPRLEAAADALLGRAGLRRTEGAADLAVQLSALPFQEPGGPMGRPTVGIGIGGGSGGSSVGIGLGFPVGGAGRNLQTRQRVEVLIRDLASGRLVFQAQATGSAAQRPEALLEAVLRDFPNAPVGRREVPLL